MELKVENERLNRQDKSRDILLRSIHERISIFFGAREEIQLI